MRAILKSTGERGEAWQSERGAWTFCPGLDWNAISQHRRVNRSDLVLLPGDGVEVGR